MNKVIYILFGILIVISSIGVCMGIYKLSKVLDNSQTKVIEILSKEDIKQGYIILSTGEKVEGIFYNDFVYYKDTLTKTKYYKKYIVSAKLETPPDKTH